MEFSKLSPECEKCQFLRWCPNKRMVAMMAIPLQGYEARDLARGTIDEVIAVRHNVDTLGLARQRPDNLDGIIEKLRDEIARTYCIPGCFFG